MFICYSCATWLKYGLMQELPVVIGVNLFGAVLNFIYTLFFYRYTIKKVIFSTLLCLPSVTDDPPGIFKVNGCKCLMVSFSTDYWSIHIIHIIFLHQICFYIAGPGVI